MKKTFQITIGGQNFTIDEQAYQILSGYLDSLKNYFSKFEGSHEIMNDIESRIAEKFYDMGLNKEVIETDHVEKIISSIGNVNDFEVLENDEETTRVSKDSAQPQSSDWYIDPKRKLVGGVLAGIAHKFNWDVVWLRIFYLILLAGLLNSGNITDPDFANFSWTGFSLIVLYFALWLIFPKRYDLEENPDIRKFYRDPENKMIAGVASGLAKYLKIDVKFIRVLFVVLAFVVFGIIIYIIIAALAPAADSVGKQLQLQGKPMTLENINLQIKEKEIVDAQSVSVRNRSLTHFFDDLFTFLGKLLRPIAGLIRVFTGIIILITGLSLIFASIVALIAFFGIAASQDWISAGGLNLSYFTNEISNTGAVLGFFSLFIPGLMLSIAGVGLIINRKTGNRNLWLTLFALWLMSLMGSGTYIAKTASNFQSYDFVEETVTLPGKINQILTIDIMDQSGEELFKPRYSLSQSENQSIGSILRKSARGVTKQEARINAKAINYNIKLDKDTLFLDENFTLKSDAGFRDQNLTVDIQIPSNMKFRFGKNFKRRSSGPLNRFKIEGFEDYEANFRSVYKTYNRFDLSEYTFKMDTNGDIVCLDCPVPNDYYKFDNEVNEDSFLSQFENYQGLYQTDWTSEIEPDQFTIAGKMKVIIKKSDQHSISYFSTDRDDESGHLFFTPKGKDNKQALIDYGLNGQQNNESDYVVMQLRNLKSLELKDGVELYLYGFEDLDKLDLKMDNESKAVIDIHVKNLNLRLNKNSAAKISGQYGFLKTTVLENSYLNARNTKINKADITAESESIVLVSKPKEIKLENYLKRATVRVEK